MITDNGNWILDKVQLISDKRIKEIRAAHRMKFGFLQDEMEEKEL